MPDTHLADIGDIRPDIRAPAGAGCADDSGAVRSAFSRLGRISLRAEPARDDGGFSEANGENRNTRALPGRGRHASGGGVADGGPLRPARGRGDSGQPNFNLAIPPNGYAWWYIDGISKTCGRAISV